jgi:uncharacterized RDD family membrane protein YckC
MSMGQRMSERRPATRIDPLAPGARAIQGLRAGVITRVIAGGIDYAVIFGFAVGCYLAWAALLFLLDPRSFAFPSWTLAQFVLIGFVAMVFYLWLAFATTGRTIGARVMGVRVVGRKGTRMRWSVALLRAGFCTVFPIGLFWCAISRENRSVQDIVLRSSVIHDWPTPTTEVTIADADLKRPHLDGP